MNNNSKYLNEDYKIVEVVKSLDSAGYIVNRETAAKLLSANSKAWFIMDDWVRYKRYANVNIYAIVPSIIIQNVGIFGSNLMEDRMNSIKSRTSKYVLSRLGFKIISDLKKYLWLMPFKGYVRNKDVWDLDGLLINRNFKF